MPARIDIKELHNTHYNFQYDIIDILMNKWNGKPIIDSYYMEEHRQIADEIFCWMLQNINGWVRKICLETKGGIMKYQLEFQNPEEATLFKLVWGGG